MFELSTIILFALACVPLTMSPGPDMLLIVGRSISNGRRAGWASLLGISGGVYAHVVIVALGLGVLLAKFPYIYDLIKYLGVGYLLYLAVQTLRQSTVFTDSGEAFSAVSMCGLVRQGFLTNVFNPKIVLFVLAFFPQFIDVSSGAIFGQMLIQATILNIVSLFVNGSVILAAGNLGHFLKKNPKMVKIQQWFLASLFVSLSAKLLLDTRE